MRQRTAEGTISTFSGRGGIRLGLYAGSYEILNFDLNRPQRLTKPASIRVVTHAFTFAETQALPH